MPATACRHLGTTLLFLAAAATATAATTRRVPQDFATIQAALDAAASGDRIVVGPGQWTQNLDFHGKDLVVVSTDGPAATAIKVAGGTGVRIGPFGALQGFTVSGATATFGAGVEVVGAGSRIAGNIFEFNDQGAGGYGAAIGGNNASPTIDGNLFRRNTCDSQFLSGVVAFINTSSPLIVNNVFAGNACRAINMTLPQGAAPVVTNNTIVGNPVGIYVDRRVPTSGQTYQNNILADNVVGLEGAFGSEAENPFWHNNLVFRNGTDYLGVLPKTGIDGNIAGDPVFRDAAAADFRLQRTSPAIDAGRAASAPAADFDGRSRPRDGNGDGVAVVDAGAFEFGRDVTISPPDGVYFRTQTFDVVVLAPDLGQIVGGAISFNGLNITGPFVACVAIGRAGAAGGTLRCPNLSRALPVGTHVFSVRFDYADGTSESRSVQWSVLANTEP